MISRSLVLWTMSSFFVSSQLPWISVAQATVEIETQLDLFLRASELPSETTLSAEDCSALKNLSHSASRSEVRLQKRAKEFFSAHCSQSGEAKGASEDNTPFSDKSGNDIWDGTAQCQTSDERLIHCEHRGENGRGLVVYTGRNSLENSPSLVCAHFEGTYRSPFEQEQQIAARCVVTEFDWRYEGMRSDVYGVKNWLYQKVAHSPLQIPAALKSQCAEVFPDAIYCTPSLIVFPESDTTRVSICQLNTLDRVFGLGAILRVGSWNSRWICESKSLMVPNQDERLSVEERQCVPDHLGQHKTPYCRFPYMPVARRPVRTYLESP